MIFLPNLWRNPLVHKTNAVRHIDACINGNMTLTRTKFSEDDEARSQRHSFTPTPLQKRKTAHFLVLHKSWHVPCFGAKRLFSEELEWNRWEKRIFKPNLPLKRQLRHQNAIWCQQKSKKAVFHEFWLQIARNALCNMSKSNVKSTSVDIKTLWLHSGLNSFSMMTDAAYVFI